MLARKLSLVAALSLVLTLLPGGIVAADDASAEPTATDRTFAHERANQLLNEADAPSDSDYYIVRLHDPAVPSYSGGIDGLAATASEAFDPASAEAVAYVEHLQADQANAHSAIADTIGRTPDMLADYQFAWNGFVLELSAAEAADAVRVEAVADVRRNEFRELNTDAGPEYMGAVPVWEGDLDIGVDGTEGEDVLVSIIDTGMNPSNPSFAAGDGEAPWEDGYLGVCDEENPEEFGGHMPDYACTDKLVGAYDMVSFWFGLPPDATDRDGHGSHVGGTVAGNDVAIEAITPGPGDPEDAFELDEPLDISGVAPNANIVSHGVCFDAGCGLISIISAIEQTIIDDADVINYSIGSTSASDVWNDPDTVGFLNARAAGIFVANSAGNSGPGFETVGSPADAPWLTSIGASEHNRAVLNSLTDLSAEGADDIPDLNGKGITEGLAEAPIVHAGDYDNPLCMVENDWDADTFDGEIVVCDRGEEARVGKSEAVAAAGGGGIVHVNDEPSADSLFADPFAVPGVHLTYADGEELKAWLAEGSDHSASITGAQFDLDSPWTGTQASFSSRGPNPSIDVVTPDVTAPGVDIIAAYGVGDPEGGTWNAISGTSMSSPHVAGAATLLTAVHPDWSPAAMQSALMTTSIPDVEKEDGSPGDPYSQGAGDVRIDLAADAGFILDESIDNYWDADPEVGGDPRELNVPSFANTECLVECSWTRTLTGTTDASWDVSVDAPENVDVTVDIDGDNGSFELGEGEQIEVTVTAGVLDAERDAHLFGELTFESDDAPTATMPMAIVPVDAIVPDEVEFLAGFSSGSNSYEAQSVAVDDLGTNHTGLAIAEQETLELPGDENNGDPFDGDPGTWSTTLDVADGQRLAAEILNHEELDVLGTDMDLFVGLGDEPSADTVMCVSAAAGNAEYCSLSELEAGTYWVLFQNWQASEPDAVDIVDVAFGATTGDETNLEVTVPDSVEDAEEFDVVLDYNEPDMEIGDRLYGYVQLIGDGEALAATDVNYTVTDTEDPPPGDPVDLVVTPEAPTIGVDGAVALSATAVYEDDSEVEVTDDADWASDDTDVATVDDAGLVTGVAEGTAEVTASFADLSDSALVTVDPEVEPGPVGLVRISAEPGRVEVAIAASQHRFGDGEADAVVLARADEYPDALAGTTLAAEHGAPLLLTSSDQLLDNVADEIARALGDDGRVFLTGGTEALDDTVEDAVEGLEYQTTRLGGQTRFETAGLIADELGDRSQVLVTTGLDFPDALTAGAAASANDGVVLLSAGDDAHDVVDGYLDGFDGEVTAVGGPATRAYPDAEPVMGETRDETAVAVADAFFDEPVAFGVSRRDDYPDALSGGAHIAAYGGPLLLSYTDDVPAETADWLQATDATGGFVYGGTAAIDEDTFDQIEDLAGFDDDEDNGEGE